MPDQTDTMKQQIDELVAMLDSFMSEGGGHMNILADENGITGEKTVETFRSAECRPGSNMACAVPTLHQGIDEEDYPENEERFWKEEE